ncbi:MAG: hypothetical protein WA432_04040 [Candidatus Babeliaceae bacterium]
MKIYILNILIFSLFSCPLFSMQEVSEKQQVLEKKKKNPEKESRELRVTWAALPTESSSGMPIYIPFNQNTPGGLTYKLCLQEQTDRKTITVYLEELLKFPQMLYGEIAEIIKKNKNIKQSLLAALKNPVFRYRFPWDLSSKQVFNHTNSMDKKLKNILNLTEEEYDPVDEDSIAALYKSNNNKAHDKKNHKTHHHKKLSSKANTDKNNKDLYSPGSSSCIINVPEHYVISKRKGILYCFDILRNKKYENTDEVGSWHDDPYAMSLKKGELITNVKIETGTWQTVYVVNNAAQTLIDLLEGRSVSHSQPSGQPPCVLL